MDLSLGEDQLSLRAAFAEFFDKESTLERVRAAEPLGFDADRGRSGPGPERSPWGCPRTREAAGPATCTWSWAAEQHRPADRAGAVHRGRRGRPRAGGQGSAAPT